MKKPIIACFLSLFLCLCSLLFSQEDVCRFRDLNEKQIKKFVEGESPDLLLHLKRGERLPLTLTVQGSLLQFSGNELGPLRVKRDLWLRNDSGEFLFSLDRHSWLTFQESFKGNISVSLNAKQKKSPLNLILEIDPR